MPNPFDLQKNDAEFVKATRDKRARQNKITQLSIGRSWILLTSIPAMVLMAPSLFFGPPNTLVIIAFLLTFVSTLGVFVHLDLQIKSLKALDKE